MPAKVHSCALIGLDGAIVAVEADLVERLDVYPVDTLGRLTAHFRNYHPIEPYRTTFDVDTDPRHTLVTSWTSRGRLQQHNTSLRFTVTRSWDESV